MANPNPCSVGSFGWDEPSALSIGAFGWAGGIVPAPVEQRAGIPSFIPLFGVGDDEEDALMAFMLGLEGYL